MDTFLFSISCIAPFFIYIAMGYGARKLLKISSDSFADVNKLSFYTFLAISLFLNIYTSDLAEIEFGPVLTLAVALVTFYIVVFWLYYGHRKISRDVKSVLIQGAFRTNFVLFGVPMTARIIGHPVSGLAGILTATIIPAFNVLAVLLLSIYSGKKPSVGSVLKGIVKNPLLIASFIAIVLNAVDYEMSDFSLKLLKSLGVAAIPVSLMALGGRFEFTSSGHTGLIVENLFFRLIVAPAIAVTIAISIGFRGEALALILVLFGSPVSVSSYTMAQQMGGNEDIASKLLVYGTCLSALSLFMFITLLKHFALI